MKWIFHEFYRRKWPSNISFKSIFLKHFNKQILHGTLTSLRKKHSSAYRVKDERRVLLAHHLGLTEEMLPLMRIIYRLSLREGIIAVAWWWSSEAPNYQKWTKFIKVLKLRSSKGGKHSSENWPNYCSKSFWFHRKMTKERKKVELTWTPSVRFSLQVFLPLSLFCPLVF